MNDDRTRFSAADLALIAATAGSKGAAPAPTGKRNQCDLTCELLTFLSERYDAAPVADCGELWTCFNGVWRPLGRAYLEACAGRLFATEANCRRVADYRAVAQFCLALANEPGFFAAAPVGLAAAGTFYRVDADGEITEEPLAPEHRQTFELSCKLSKEPPARWLAFLDDCFEGNDESLTGPRPLVSAETARKHASAQIALLQEVAGAILTRSGHKLHQAVLLEGRPRAGKGTCMHVLSALLPESVRCAIPPHRFAEEYYAAQLAGKVLNVVGELDQERPIPAEFKSVIGGDVITGRQPTHQVFSFSNTATHVFMSNYFPPSRDIGDAFFERWACLHFPFTVPVAKRDADLRAKLIDEELGAIAWWALEGAARLIKRGRYASTPVHTAMLDKWRGTINSVGEFLTDDEVITRDASDDEGELKSLLWSAYVAWCKDGARRPFGRNHFYDQLLDLGARWGIREHRIEGVRVFVGLHLTQAGRTLGHRD